MNILQQKDVIERIGLGMHGLSLTLVVTGLLFIGPTVVVVVERNGCL